MILYELDAPPGDIEGEPTEEYFTSLHEASRRRAEIIQEYSRDGGCPPSGCLRIDRVVVAKLPARKLAMRLLNRSGWCEKRETVVPEL
jgi:hypothetical protein